MVEGRAGLLREPDVEGWCCDGPASGGKWRSGVPVQGAVVEYEGCNVLREDDGRDEDEPEGLGSGIGSPDSSLMVCRRLLGSDGGRVYGVSGLERVEGRRCTSEDVVGECNDSCVDDADAGRPISGW